MQVEEFIVETLGSIARGVAEARVICSKHGCNVGPTYDEARASQPGLNLSTIQPVTFDLQVQVTESKNIAGKGSVEILSVLQGGCDASTSTSNASSSRVQFSIPMLINTTPIAPRNWVAGVIRTDGRDD